MNYIQEYYDKITAGDILVCKPIQQQMQFLIDDIKHPKSISYQNEKDQTVTLDYVFNAEQGLYTIEFIETFCKHSKAPWTGKPVELELFQKAKIQAAYGFIDRNTGLRQYNEVHTFIGRKNGKTTEGAAIGNYHLVADNEGGAEVVSVATKKDIARKSFNEAVNMVSQSEELKGIVKKRKSELWVPDTFSEFKPLASDSNTLDGLNISLGLLDEIHAWKNRNLYDVIVQATGARLQPMIWLMSTMGFQREGLCDNLIGYAYNVLNGTFPRDFNKLFFIYKLDDKEEWTNPKMWIKANPGLGTIKQYKYLHDKVEEAKRNDQLRPTVLTKDFNIIETTAGSWLSFDVIHNETTFDLAMFKDFYCIGGNDLSATTDLTCTTLLFMHPDKYKDFPVIDPETGEVIEGKTTRKYYKYLHQHYFIPQEVMKKRVHEDKVPYDIWAERGLVTEIPGNSVDPSYLTAWYVKMLEQNGFRPLWNGYDPWGTTVWLNQMTDKGFTMEKVRQGAQTMSGPAKQMAADLADDLLIYNNNPIFEWCLTNTNMKVDENGNIRPIKKENATLRIDGTVSAINAYVVLMEHYQDYLNLI